MRRLPALLTALALALALAVLFVLALAATSARIPLARALRSLLVGALVTPPDVSLWALPRAQGAVALLVLLALLTCVALARVSGVLGLALLYCCAPRAPFLAGHAAHEEEDPCAD